MIEYCQLIRRQDQVVGIEIQQALEIGQQIRNEMRPPEELANILRQKAKSCRPRAPAVAAYMEMTADNLDGKTKTVHWWQRD